MLDWTGTHTFSTPPSGGTATVAISVEQRNPLAVAPEAVKFSATVSGFTADGTAGGASYDDRYSDLVYLWDFGDEDADYTAPVNVLAGWKDGNVGRGPKPVHVYRTAGDYTVTLTVVEPATGVWGTASFTLASGGDAAPVGDPASVYTKTTVGAAGDYTTIGAALNALDGSAANIWLELADETFVFDNDDYRAAGFRASDIANLLITPAAGATPVLKHKTTSANGKYLFYSSGDCSTFSMTVQGVTFQGGWNPVTQSSDDAGKFDRPAFAMFSHPRYFLTTDCTVAGYSTFFFDSTGSALDGGMHVAHNMDIQDFRDVGYFIAGPTTFAALGSRITAHPSALSGGPKNAPFNNHCPIRLNHIYACDIYIDGCDFFNRFGWPPAAGYRGIQSAIRFNQYQAEAGTLAYIGRSSLESSGANVLVATPMNQIGVDSPVTHQALPQQLIIDACHFRGGDQTQAMIRTCNGGLTLRNCILDMPDIAGTTRVGDFDCYIELTDDYLFTNGAYDTRTDPIQVYNNTCLSLIDGDPAASLIEYDGSSANWTDVTAANNIVHQPAATGGTDYGTFTGTALWTARDVGYRHGYTSADVVLSGDVSGSGGTLDVPYTSFDLTITQSDIETSYATHDARIGSTVYTENCAWSFDADSVTVTNNSGVTWTTGQTVSVGLRLDPTQTITDPLTGSAPVSTTVAAMVPGSGNTAIGAAITGLRAYEDFAQTVRDGNQPSTIDAGAMEVQ